MEWSKLLFKCIKPVGEPEFRLNGDIATHTITLHLEMTELDLSGAEASCTREDLKRYRRLGLTLEEVVEVSMKLNALKGLGVNLKIEGKHPTKRSAFIVNTSVKLWCALIGICLEF